MATHKVKNMKNFFILIILMIPFPSLTGQNKSDLNCFSVLVGKNASVDGSVFFAHNEDDEGENFVDIHKVPRIRHAPGEKQIFVDYLDSISEVPETYGN
jgi:hypothetical protein